ncbi:MAG: cupin domain-containing protein [Anaerolineales bacterium]|nr:cupin domain-containing protein [Anaerolineales bacterium]
MSEIPEDFRTMKVGERLRALRMERELSLRGLARSSGLSTNALSMIERDRTSPSVSTLYKISEALGVPITAFFRVEPERNKVVFRKADERSRIPFKRGDWEGLGGEAFDGGLEPFLVTLEAGTGSGPYPMLHSGHEFVLCLEGDLEYEVDGQHYLLDEGDSLIFAAQMKHRWRNPGKRLTRAVIVICGFQQGERPSEFHLTPGKDEDG